MDGSAGSYIRYASKFPRLSFEEEKELMRKYKEEGDIGARNKVVMDQQWMVSRMARKYSNNGSFMDLVNRGNEGLIYALENFDISRGVRVITYCSWSIKRSMIRESLSLDHERMNPGQQQRWAVLKRK